MKRFNRKEMPTGWRVQTGLNPDYFIDIKKWMKERGRQVAEARRTGNVDAAIKALNEGKSYKAAIKSTLEKNHSYFVYDPNGECKYIFERKATQKWVAFNVL